MRWTKTPAAFGAGIGPFDVALRRRVRQHEPADRVGAINVDDGFRRDHILLGLGHLLGRPISTAVSVPQKRLAVALFDFVRRCDPGAVGVLVGLVADHALGEQAGERLGHDEIAAARMARVKKRA
jgi:hypothetical protein